MIEFNDVTKTFSGAAAVDGISFQVHAGELFVLIGPSGCGKTTTMKMMNRLIEPDSGSILIDDKNIKELPLQQLRWNTGYVLQQIALFPHMTVEENIAVVPEMCGWSASAVSGRTDELLELIGLDPGTYRSRLPAELSGGQQQRIGVARALAADPDILLMDEPFSALDPISRSQLQDEMKELQRTIQKTIVFVTHDMDEALKLGDRIAVMKEGRLVQLDTPERVTAAPADDFVRSFIGERQSVWQRQAAVLPMEETTMNISGDTSGTAASAETSLEDVYSMLRSKQVQELPVHAGGKTYLVTDTMILDYVYDVQRGKEAGDGRSS
ncbi:ABC transporter ATP-binding protein [Alkalicoccus chagannorensis]|uniref:ABC transporter ATP-binding protein n=1 Tax=Alkalicoccus chagannorensis TaxID=427072 RepID=UPI00041C9F6D|nr:ABC transporter ATP-binding protein [Alkalicoccus chagannorensis]